MLVFTVLHMLSTEHGFNHCPMVTAVFIVIYYSTERPVDAAHRHTHTHTFILQPLLFHEICVCICVCMCLSVCVCVCVCEIHPVFLINCQTG